MLEERTKIRPNRASESVIGHSPYQATIGATRPFLSKDLTAGKLITAEEKAWEGARLSISASILEALALILITGRSSLEMPATLRSNPSQDLRMYELVRREVFT